MHVKRIKIPKLRGSSEFITNQELRGILGYVNYEHSWTLKRNLSPTSSPLFLTNSYSLN